MMQMESLLSYIYQLIVRNERIFEFRVEGRLNQPGLVYKIKKIIIKETKTMHTNQNHKTLYRIITALLLILWITFIFSNSLDNADASTAKSGTVLALLRRILGSEGADLTEFIVRKTAHFTEFAIEGVLLFSVVKGYTTRPLRFLGWPLLAGLITALADETIQLFSLGRSSQVTDVWIDFAGVVTGTLLALLVQAIVRRCKKS